MYTSILFLVTWFTMIRAITTLRMDMAYDDSFDTLLSNHDLGTCDDHPDDTHSRYSD